MMASFKLSYCFAFFVLLLTLSTAQPPRKDACERAFDDCVLTFEGTDGLTTFDITARGPDRAFTPNIVAKDPHVNIGVVNSNIEGDFILRNGKAVPFSKFIPRRSGVQPLTPNFFKPFTPAVHGRFSGIGHETPQRGQLRFLKGRCVRVFFTELQIIDPHTYNVVDNLNGIKARRFNVCVVFRAAVGRPKRKSYY